MNKNCHVPSEKTAPTCSHMEWLQWHVRLAQRLCLKLEPENKWNHIRLELKLIREQHSEDRNQGCLSYNWWSCNTTFNINMSLSISLPSTASDHKTLILYFYLFFLPYTSTNLVTSRLFFYFTNPKLHKPHHLYFKNTLSKDLIGIMC